MRVGSRRVIDVSLKLPDEGTAYPGDLELGCIGPKSFIGGTAREYCYWLSLSTQSGTHIQGAHYFHATGKRIAEYPIERFEGPTLVLEFGDRVIDGADLARQCGEKNLESLHLLFRTGFTTRLTASSRRRLTSEDLLAKPGLTIDAAEYLVNRGAKFIGIDAPGFELYPSSDWAVNRMLCGADILLLENLVRLEGIPREGAWLQSYPLPISGVEGTPCRAIVTVWD